MIGMNCKRESGKSVQASLLDDDDDDDDDGDDAITCDPVYQIDLTQRWDPSLKHGLEPHHQMLFIIIHKTTYFEGILPLWSGHFSMS